MNNAIREENEKKKEYLGGYRRHGRRIKRIDSEIEEIRSMKMSASAMKGDGMPHGSGTASDLSDYVAKLVSLEEELYQEGIKQVESYKEIDYKISEVHNEDERDVLFYRYIKGKNFWEISQIMDYSERQIRRIHRKAIENIKI